MKYVPVKVWPGKIVHTHGLPKYETAGAAGLDIRANIQKPITIEPGETVLIPTGLHMAIPDGFEVQVRPRSGMSFKTKFRIPNSPGTIDSDYRGELGIIAENIHPAIAMTITPGERICQIVIQEVLQLVWQVVDSLEELPPTSRGEGGLGSSGTH